MRLILVLNEQIDVQADLAQFLVDVTSKCAVFIFSVDRPLFWFRLPDLQYNVYLCLAKLLYF